MSSLKLLHSGGNGVIISAPSSNPAANRTITLNDTYAGDGSFVTANSSGNVGINKSNPSYPFVARRTDASGIIGEFANSSGYGLWIGQASASGEAYLRTGTGQSLAFKTNGDNERMRIDSSGRLLAGRTNNITVGGDASDHCFEQLTDNGYALTVHCDKAQQRGIGLYYTTGKTAEAAFAYQIGSTWKTIIRSDGDLENANNSYGSISDVSFKENIVDAKSQWNDIKNIKVRNYNFKESTGQQTHTQIGVIAQELETVSPKLVRESEGGMKTVSYSVLYMKAIKALQEAQTRIETLETKVAALEGA